MTYFPLVSRFIGEPINRCSSWPGAHLARRARVSVPRLTSPIIAQRVRRPTYCAVFVAEKPMPMPGSAHEALKVPVDARRVWSEGSFCISNAQARARGTDRCATTA